VTLAIRCREAVGRSSIRFDESFETHMTTFLATGGLLLLAAIVTACLWPPKSSRMTTLLLTLWAMVLVTALIMAVAVILIVTCIACILIVAMGLPMPTWLQEAVPDWMREGATKFKQRLIGGHREDS
jgi:hypothetical protein